MKSKKLLSFVLAGSMVFGIAYMSNLNGFNLIHTVSAQSVKTTLSKIDNTKWQYNETDKIYWQVGISYCENPVDTKYETLGIFVPAAYMTAKDNGDGTFTCTINENAKIGNYTAATAPIVIPINTPGYSAMAAPTDYVSSASSYTNAGFIYVNAGCRGRDAGAPAGITDLKAAVRYIRYNSGNIAGSTDRIFSFGMSGGGAQSALLGATGNSYLYEPYLKEIGAIQGVKDDIAGAMCWCPITSLDYADAAYEWNLGSTRQDLTQEEQFISDRLAEQFALYINKLELRDDKGRLLTLSESEEGIYQSGSYYDYLKSVVENSLNNFLKDTTFPYTVTTKKGGPAGAGNIPNGAPNIENTINTNSTPSTAPNTTTNNSAEVNTSTQSENSIYAVDNITRNTTTSGITISGTYNTVQDYIKALNAENEWVYYDSSTNTAKITSIEDFTKALKVASKDLGAFDSLDKSQGENTLFGYADGNGAHFDEVLAKILKNTTYEKEFTTDLTKEDRLGKTVNYRVDMYNPMYYIEDYYKGYKQSDVAKYWRIRTGINQSDTSLTTEVNLALALSSYGKEVDFETVWGQGHTQAERTGESTENFITWVNESLK